ncbi:hypothetical protein SKAU_G00325930 [Synaphobranchus kaupii]|uniref:Uncharacterized protein n=1 Tax=Synaphobranchus kaupii TaxID=118154 RepID=A0A9Q1EPL1_SYNKA|nr:hypothetical protein SKAU_G00325930 [Synaphobranchus kaupii]
MGSRDERQILSRVGTRFPLTLKDVRTVCPLDLLEDSSLQMPWLTDDTVSLGHFEYVLWHLWGGPKMTADKALLRRLVGHTTPETGNHFILWVFDFQRKEIRVYDSLKMKPTVTPGKMLLLSNAFRDRGGLEGWAVKYPEQWRQKDNVNCDVFVCTAAENEVQNIEVRSEDLSLSQCKELRKYHAASMIKELEVMDFPPTKNEVDMQQEKETKLQNEDKRRHSSNYHCMAAKMKTCLFQRSTASKRTWQALNNLGLGGLLTSVEIENLNSDLLHGRKLSHRIHRQGYRGRPSYQKIISSNVRFWTIFGENEKGTSFSMPRHHHYR